MKKKITRTEYCSESFADFLKNSLDPKEQQLFAKLNTIMKKTDINDASSVNAALKEIDIYLKETIPE